MYSFRDQCKYKYAPWFYAIATVRMIQWYRYVQRKHLLKAYQCC